MIYLVKAKSVWHESVPDNDGAASLLGRTEGAGEEKSFGLSYVPSHVSMYILCMSSPQVPAQYV